MATTRSRLGARLARALGCGGALLLGAAAHGVAAQAPAARMIAGRVTTLVQGIGDAENATFSDDGRLFVTGGANAYELVRRGDRIVADPLYEGTCNFTGIAVRAGVLYAACAEGTDLVNSRPLLLAARLSARVALKVVHPFEKLGIPNGLAFDARGRLLVSDFTPLAGKIVAVTLSPDDPLRVTREQVWHDLGHPLANGLKVYDEKVYLTDLTDIKIIPIRADGSAGRATVLASRLAVLDDLYVDASGILVGDFYGGRLVSYDHAGKMIGQTAMLFSAPSSITPGRPPLVPDGALVVTEKGALGELTSDDGNRVSLLRLSP